MTGLGGFRGCAEAKEDGRSEDSGSQPPPCPASLQLVCLPFGHFRAWMHQWRNRESNGPGKCMGLEKVLYNQRLVISAGSIFHFHVEPPWPSDGLKRQPQLRSSTGDVFRQSGPKEDRRAEGSLCRAVLTTFLKARVSTVMPPPTAQGLHMCGEGHREGIQTQVGGGPEVPRFSVTHCCLPHLTLLAPQSGPLVPLGMLADLHRERPGWLSESG